MHEELDFLALSSSTRYVARCGYSCVNLVWGRTSIHLTSQEFLGVERFLRRCEDQLLKEDIYGDADNVVVGHEKGYREVWLLGTGFYLDPTSFGFLIALAHDAAEHLKATMGSEV